MIDQIAEEYAGENVVFLDYQYPGQPKNRWEVIQRTAPELGLTWAMVESGQAYSRGVETPEDAYNSYTAMIDAYLNRVPMAEIESYYWREGGTIHVIGTVKNISSVTLSTANMAGFSASVKWPGPMLGAHTTHNGAMNSATTVIDYLAPGETATYRTSVTTWENNVDWDAVEVYTMVDYETEPGGIFDQLQADRATMIADPGDIGATPNYFYHFVPAEQLAIEDMEVTITGMTGMQWAASVDETWLQIDKAIGVVGDKLTLSVDKADLVEGWQDATVTITPIDGNDITSVYVRIYLGFPDEIRDLFLPFVFR